MRWEKIVQVFGQGDTDAATTVIRLAAECPSFGMRDFFFVIDEVVRMRGTELDVNPSYREVLSSSRQVGKPMYGISATLSSFRKMCESGTYYVSDIVFRNLCRVLFDTDAWDDDVIFKPEFSEELAGRVAEMKKRISGPSGLGPEPVLKYLDMFKKLSEFMEKATEKIQARSGI